MADSAAKKHSLTVELNFRPNQTQLNQLRGKIGKTLSQSPVDSKAIQQATKNTQQLTTATERFGAAAGKAMKWSLAYHSVTTAVYGLTRAITSGVKEAFKFETQMVRIAQVTGTSLSVAKDFGKEIHNVAIDLGASSSELSKLSVTLAQTGMSLKDVKTAMRGIAEASLAPTFGSMANTAEGFIATMRQFKMSADETVTALSSINAASKAFAVESSDIIMAVQKAGGVFSTFANELDTPIQQFEKFASLMVAVRANTREAAAPIATGLKTIFGRMQRESTVQMLAGQGINLREKGRFVGPHQAIQRIGAGLGQMDQRGGQYAQIVEQLGGIRQLPRLIALIQNQETARQALGVMQSGRGSIKSDVDRAMEARQRQWAQVQERFIKLMYDITETDAFQTMVDAAISTANALIFMTDAVKAVIPVLLAAGAARGFTAAMPAARGMQFGFGSTAGIKRAEGGPVPGFGGADKVPAMLTPGEFVVNKDAAKKLGMTNLFRINSKKYNAGTGAGGVPPGYDPKQWALMKKLNPELQQWAVGSSEMMDEGEMKYAKQSHYQYRVRDDRSYAGTIRGENTQDRVRANIARSRRAAYGGGGTPYRGVVFGGGGQHSAMFGGLHPSSGGGGVRNFPVDRGYVISAQQARANIVQNTNRDFQQYFRPGVGGSGGGGGSDYGHGGSRMFGGGGGGEGGRRARIEANIAASRAARYGGGQWGYTTSMAAPLTVPIGGTTASPDSGTFRGSQGSYSNTSGVRGMGPPLPMPGGGRHHVVGRGTPMDRDMRLLPTPPISSANNRLTGALAAANRATVTNMGQGPVVMGGAAEKAIEQNTKALKISTKMWQGLVKAGQTIKNSRVVSARMGQRGTMGVMAAGMALPMIASSIPGESAGTSRLKGAMTYAGTGMMMGMMTGNPYAVAAGGVGGAVYGATAGSDQNIRDAKVRSIAQQYNLRADMVARHAEIGQLGTEILSPGSIQTGLGVAIETGVFANRGWGDWAAETNITANSIASDGTGFSGQDITKQRAVQRMLKDPKSKDAYLSSLRGTFGQSSSLAQEKIQRRLAGGQFDMSDEATMKDVHMSLMSGEGKHGTAYALSLTGIGDPDVVAKMAAKDYKEQHNTMLALNKSLLNFRDAVDGTIDRMNTTSAIIDTIGGNTSGATAGFNASMGRVTSPLTLKHVARANVFGNLRGYSQGSVQQSLGLMGRQLGIGNTGMFRDMSGVIGGMHDVQSGRVFGQFASNLNRLQGTKGVKNPYERALRETLGPIMKSLPQNLRASVGNISNLGEEGISDLVRTGKLTETIEAAFGAVGTAALDIAKKTQDAINQAQADFVQRQQQIMQMSLGLKTAAATRSSSAAMMLNQVDVMAGGQGNMMAGRNAYLRGMGFGGATGDNNATIASKLGGRLRQLRGQDGVSAAGERATIVTVLEMIAGDMSEVNKNTKELNDLQQRQDQARGLLSSIGGMSPMDRMKVVGDIQALAKVRMQGGPSNMKQAIAAERGIAFQRQYMQGTGNQAGLNGLNDTEDMLYGGMANIMGAGGLAGSARGAGRDRLLADRRKMINAGGMAAGAVDEEKQANLAKALAESQVIFEQSLATLANAMRGFPSVLEVKGTIKADIEFNGTDALTSKIAKEVYNQIGRYITMEADKHLRPDGTQPAM